MHTQTDRCGIDRTSELPNALNHRSCRGDDVVDQHRRTFAPLRKLRHRDLDLAVAAALLAQRTAGTEAEVDVVEDLGGLVAHT